ncbi:MAG: hypothetical protein ACXWFC_01895 [Nitrososphaeraceae archaeon]
MRTWKLKELQNVNQTLREKDRIIKCIAKFIDKLILLSERLDAIEKSNSNKIIEREFLFSLKVNIPTIGFNSA